MKKTYTVLAAMALAGSASGSAVAADQACTTACTTPTAVCAGEAATKWNVAGGPGSPYTMSDSFLKTGFAVQCSANTHVAFANMSGTLFTVGAGSAKGNQTVKGSSNGGAVVTHTKCTGTNDACTAANVTVATSAASSM
jgi:hypothetical protein